MPESLHISEAVVRHAIANTKNGKEAAEFLNIHPDTWRKYASMYIDTETGLTLNKIHTAAYKKSTNWKQYWLENIAPKFRYTLNEPTPLIEVFANEKPYKDKKYLLRRMVKEGVRPLQCELCSYNSRPIYQPERNMTSPYYWSTYKLINLDNNLDNNSLTNLLIVCLNCRHCIFRNKEEYDKLIRYEDGSVKTPTDIIKSIMSMIGMEFDLKELELSEKNKSLLGRTNIAPGSIDVDDKKAQPEVEGLKNILEDDLGSVDWDG